MNALIVEDDPVASAILAKILANEPGLQTVAVDSGEAAWALLDDPSRGFDLLFLDLTLPKMDGFALLERIRASPILKRLEIVVCTASKDRTTVQRAVGLGIRHYLVKPCTEGPVVAKLRQIKPEDPAYLERRLV